MIELIKTYPVSFFLFTGLLISLVFTIVEEIKRKKRKNNHYLCKMKQKEENILNKQLDIYGAITTPWELIRETIINFLWGFMGNSIVVFMSKGVDSMVILNFILYYMLISYIVNRDKYHHVLGS